MHIFFLFISQLNHFNACLDILLHYTYIRTYVRTTYMHTTDAPVLTPPLAVLFPGDEVILNCNTAVTSTLLVWLIDGTVTLTSMFPPGVSLINDTILNVTMSPNATMYTCGVVIGGGNVNSSNKATVVLAG